MKEIHELYNAYYFRHGCGEIPYARTEVWLQHFQGIAEQIVKRIGPRRVLDVGCAMGFLVEALRAHGVEAFGIDVSEYAVQQIREDIRPYCWVGSVTDPLPGRYDLIVCIEVLEHLPPPQAQRAVHHLCQVADDILFSSTPEDYKEWSHLNVQPPEYWAELFALEGFVRDVDFDASFIAPWAGRFRRQRDPLHRLIAAYERKQWRLWKENLELRQELLNIRAQHAASEARVMQLEARTAHLERQIDEYERGKLARFMRWLRRRPMWWPKKRGQP